jgi:hypothetical protein
MSKGRTLPVLAAVLLTACHGDASQAPVAKAMPTTGAPAAAKRGPTPEEMTAGMVEAVTSGKSTVPVAVKFGLGARPTVGQPLELTIALMPQVAASSATVQVTGSDGLQLAPGVTPIEIPSIDPTHVYRLTIMLNPTADGVQLLGINVTLKHEDTAEMRSFSVPVIVGSSVDTASNAAH